MKLPDTNVLVYAVDERSPYHDQAREWLAEMLSGSETLAFAWSGLIGFLRVATHPALADDPRSSDAVLEVIEGWLAQPPAVVVHPTDRHAIVLRDLLAPLGTAGNLVPDAHLAALAIEHGAELVSFDHDFGRFPGLRWVDPAGA